MKVCLNFVSAVAFALILCISHQAAAQGPVVNLNDVSLYAGGTLTFDSFTSVEGGATVAVGDVFGSLDVDSIFGQGSLSSNGFDDSRGEIFFNGGISGVGGPGSVLDGPVTSATGNIEISGSSTVNGNVTAAGDVSQTFSFGTFNGNVLAGGNVEIDGTVNGNVTHGGALTLGVFSDVTGSTSAGGAVSPAPFVAPTLPSGSGLVATGSDINLTTFEDISLAPGNFGTLNFASANTVSLTSGTYIFEDIISTFRLNELAFDTSAGPINIFVENSDVTLDLIQSINGVSLFAGVEPPLFESNNITLEVGGSLTLGSDFFGTLLVPNGNLDLESDLTGRALVGGDVILSGSVLTVPEPSSLLIGIGLLGLSAVRRNRRGI